MYRKSGLQTKFLSHNINNSKRLINKNIVNSVVPHEVICAIVQFFSNVCTYQLLRNNPPKERLITVF